MYRNRVILLCLLLSAVLYSSAESVNPISSATHWIPANAILTLEVNHPNELFDFVFSPRIEKAIQASPAYLQMASQSGFKEFQGVIDYLEMLLGVDWRTGIREIFGGGATLAILPEDRVVFVIDAKNGEMLKQLHNIFLGFAKDDAQKQGQADRVKSRDFRGHTIWSFGGDESHVLIDKRLLWANHPDTIESVLILQETPDGKSMANAADYQSARKSILPDTAISSFANMSLLKQNPPIRNALMNDPNPLAALLLAEIPEILLDSNWIAAGLNVSPDALNLQINPDGSLENPTGIHSFALSKQSGEGVLPNLSVPRQIAGFSFCRDIYRFYSAKDDLFPERTSGLIFFENMMGIFFTGRDLTEEVWAEIKPEIRIVVSEQTFETATGTPRVQIPAFALILRLRRPDVFGQVAEEAWQKALGLINFTRGQQAQAGLLIDREFFDDTKFSFAYFSSLEEENKAELESRFNFRPAIVTLNDYLVLSSTDGLAKDLIVSLKKENGDTIKPINDTHSLAELDFHQLTSILNANRENLIRQNMLEKGHTKDKAEFEIGMLLSILQNFNRATMNVGNVDGRTKANLKIELNLPES